MATLAVFLLSQCLTATENTSVFGGTVSASWFTLGLLIPVAFFLGSRLQILIQRRKSKPPATLGPYVLKEKLGAGGMGEVYRAEHQLMKRTCAIKLIHPEQAEDAEMRANFEREAQATAGLTHWNTVEVYDYGTSADGRFYYVMEYLRGVNLAEYVGTYGPMSAARVVYILRQICEALFEASTAGLVHRDIKPSNIFLTQRGMTFDVAKLLDFGLVHTALSDAVGLKQVSTKLHGSPAFMCPEQAVGMTPDARGDIYSLGAVAYYLLSGRPPFVDENPIMLIVAHATTTAPSFDDIGVEVPNDLARVIMTCLQRDPSARYGSARELLEALEECRLPETWTWRDAEQWWQEHQLASSVKPVGAIGDDPTVQIARSAIPAGKPICDFDQPTEIHDIPRELQTV